MLSKKENLERSYLRNETKMTLLPLAQRKKRCGVPDTSKAED
jgi:hypothetical protein